MHIHRQKPHGHRQVEAARAAGAWVEVEDAFLRDEIWDMSVAVEDGGKSGCYGVEVEGLKAVEHVEVKARVGRVLDEDDVGFGQLAAGAFAVDVAADGGDGSDLLELGQDGEFSHVAAVKDSLDAGEGWQDFGTKEAVGIRDDAEFHVFRISCAGGGRLREGTHAN